MSFFLNFVDVHTDLKFTIQSFEDKCPKLFVLDKNCAGSEEDVIASRSFIQLAEYLPVEVNIEGAVSDYASTEKLRAEIKKIINYTQMKNKPGYIWPRMPAAFRKKLKKVVVGATSEEDALCKFMSAMGSATLTK